MKAEQTSSFLFHTHKHVSAGGTSTLSLPAAALWAATGRPHNKLISYIETWATWSQLFCILYFLICIRMQTMLRSINPYDEFPYASSSWVVLYVFQKPARKRQQQGGGLAKCQSKTFKTWFWMFSEKLLWNIWSYTLSHPCNTRKKFSEDEWSWNIIQMITFILNNTTNSKAHFLVFLSVDWWVMSFHRSRLRKFIYWL